MDAEKSGNVRLDALRIANRVLHQGVFDYISLIRGFRKELSEGSHAGEVVGCHSEHEHLITSI